MDELIKAISKYPKGTAFVVTLSSGLKIKAELDTVFETDNGFDQNEPEYQAYHAGVLRVQNILNSLPQNEDNEIDALIEISMQDPPKGIWLEDGTAVWP